MDEEKTLNADATANVGRLDFLYKRISMPRVCMGAWLRVPEFVEAINALDLQGVKITDRVFLEVAEPILQEKLLDRKANKELRLSTLKRGLRFLHEGGVELEEESKFRFLYDIFPKITGSHLAFWIAQPEFQREISELMNQHICIDKDDVMGIMQDIFDEKYARKKSGERVEFNFQRARRAIRQLSTKLWYNDCNEAEEAPQNV